MNAKMIAIVGLALVLILALAAWVDSPVPTEQPGVITVTGDAEVRVVPDEVILKLGVQTWDKDLDKAKRQNDQIVASVITLAEERGIAPEHVKTDYVGIEPRYRNGYYEDSDFIGFFVRKTMVITLRDLDLFEDLLSDALKSGVNYVHGIEFRTTDLRQHRDEARALAARAAREKAEALARELGQSVGEPQLIEEVQSGWVSAYNRWWGMGWNGGMAQNVIQELSGGDMAGGGTLAPGQISVRAQVSVTFGLK